MQAQFWFDSWQHGGEKIGFHRKDLHPYVLKYFPPEKLVDKKVLIPLCGKTVDMVYFRQHAAHVTGVELVESAVLQFFADHNLPFEKRDNRYEAKQLTIICSDFLTLARDDLGHIDLVYDRASLVALPSTMRIKYISKVNELLPIGGQQFITTLEYFPLWNEPPFSVTPKDIVNYYGANHSIQHLEQPMQPQHSMVREYNRTYLREHGFLLCKHSEVMYN